MVLSLQLGSALAAPGAGPPPSGPGSGGPGVALPSEEEDFSPTPYTEYGEFNEERDEEEETLFLQTGRFFGVSLGIGAHLLDGGRGQLYKGGAPLFDMRIHYWFDYHLALDLGFYAVSHYYDEEIAGRWDVNFLQMGVNIRYYLNTADMSAPVTFASPFGLIGVGQLNKNDEPAAKQFKDQKEAENVFMYNFGLGLEFPIKPRKTYFQLIGKMIVANFSDSTTTRFQDSGINDLRGRFYSVTGNILFTW